MSNTTNPVVRTPYGPLRGIRTGAVDAFLGVPYAAPPVGKLRWRPPAAMSPWPDERDATAFGPWSAQNVLLHGLGAASASEDCLYLNVFAPAVPSPTPRPVMVWFHGGGLWCGRPHDYDPRRLVEEGGVVFVSVGYRLNVFGFFAHPALAAEPGPHGNYGIQDQQAALRWVQQCIEHFGGDPENVTIAGQSAGARSVEAHLCSPTSAGLFHRAIVQSGRTGGLVGIEQAEAVGKRLGETLGLERATAAELRQLPAEAILAVNTPAPLRERGTLAILGMGGPFTVGMIEDGTTVPMPMSDAFADGAFHRVPVMLGITRDEGTWFVGLDEVDCGSPLTDDDYRALVTSSFPTATAERVARLYPVTGTPAAAAAAMLGDFVFVAPERRTVRHIAAHGNPVYAFIFDVPDTPCTFLAVPGRPVLGSAHMAELPYLFERFRGASGPGGVLSAVQAGLAADIRSAWTTFARDGVPASRDGGPAWRRYDLAADNFTRLATGGVDDVGVAELHHCDFWDEVAQASTESQSAQ